MSNIVIYNSKQKERLALAHVAGVAECLTQAEKMMYRASVQRPISDYTKEELLRTLAEPIKYIMRDVGIRDEENVYALTRTTEILQRYYGDISVDDFRAAFEMAVIGELDAYLPKRDGQPDRGHYQSFNAEYVCKILRAYRLRRAEMFRKADEKRPPETPARDTEREKKETAQAREFLFKDFLYYKYHARMPRISPAGVIVYHKFLAGLGLVEDFPVTLEEQAQTITANAAVLAGKPLRVTPTQAKRRSDIERAFRYMAENEIQATILL